MFDCHTITPSLLASRFNGQFTRTDVNAILNYLTYTLDNTIALTDASGNSDIQYSYDPYGNTKATGSSSDRYTYTEREFDELGIYYYCARYYDSATGRFLSEGPNIRI